jgi:phage tail-like protein
LGFQRVSGLSYGVRDERKWTEITETYTPIKLPDVLDYTDLVFSHGIYLKGSEGDDWFNTVTKSLADGRVDGYNKETIRRTITITVENKGSGGERQYKVYGAYPKAIRVGDLNAMAQEVLIQQLVIAHEGIGVVDQASVTTISGSPSMDGIA